MEVKGRGCVQEQDCLSLILPANDGHPVKRVQYATEVNDDKTNSSKEDDPETVLKGIQG